jgi:hypothetical protein
MKKISSHWILAYAGMTGGQRELSGELSLDFRLRGNDMKKVCQKLWADTSKGVFFSFLFTLGNIFV